MRRAMLLALSLTLSAEALAHIGAPLDQDQPAPTFKVERLSERVYCLYGQGGNVGFLVTDDGVLVVDDQYGHVAQGIVDQIKAVTDKPIRYLVNTHYHADHTGGNKVFIKLANIIAHDNVRTKMLDFPEVIQKTYPARAEAVQKELATLSDPNDAYRVTLEKNLGLLKFFLDDATKFVRKDAAPPGLTFDNQMKVWLGDEEVQIHHAGPGHTDGDAIVWFRTQKVLHMGDLFFNGMYPFIDALGGGSSRGYVEGIDFALGLVPADTRIIPGHGPATDTATLKRARDFLADLRVQVEKAVRSGMSKADAIRAIRMDSYPEIKPAFQSLGNDIAVMYDEIKSGR